MRSSRVRVIDRVTVADEPPGVGLELGVAVVAVLVRELSLDCAVALNGSARGPRVNRMSSARITALFANINIPTILFCRESTIPSVARERLRRNRDTHKQRATVHLSPNHKVCYNTLAIARRTKGMAAHMEEK